MLLHLTGSEMEGFLKLTILDEIQLNFQGLWRFHLKGLVLTECGIQVLQQTVIAPNVLSIASRFCVLW